LRLSSQFGGLTLRELRANRLEWSGFTLFAIFMTSRNDVSQTQQDLQLKVWKELAISKQMLMRAATDALKLNPECTQEELKEALEGALKKAAKADTDLFNAKEEAKVAISALEKKVAASEERLAVALKAAADAQAAQEDAVQQVVNQRAAAARELQKVKDRLAEREKALKAINTALADTPENLLRKMNALKKQKQEEADSRRQVESALNTLRAEKRQQDEKTADVLRNGATLVSRYRDLRELSLKLHEQLQPLVEDAKSLPEIPELDTELLEAIEQPADRKSKQPARSGRALPSS
jgi:colicin import membrane protein